VLQTTTAKNSGEMVQGLSTRLFNGFNLNHRFAIAQSQSRLTKLAVICLFIARTKL